VLAYYRAEVIPKYWWSAYTILFTRHRTWRGGMMLYRNRIYKLSLQYRPFSVIREDFY